MRTVGGGRGGHSGEERRFALARFAIGPPLVALQQHLNFRNKCAHTGVADAFLFLPLIVGH